MRLTQSKRAVKRASNKQRGRDKAARAKTLAKESKPPTLKEPPWTQPLKDAEE